MTIEPSLKINSEVGISTAMENSVSALSAHHPPRADLTTRRSTSGGSAWTTKAFELPAQPSSVFAPRAVRLWARSNGQGKQSQHLLERCLCA